MRPLASLPGETVPVKVLVVDDSPLAVQLIVDSLSTEPYTVLTADTGGACLEIAAQEMPDVVLLDVMLPGMSGFDVCQRLRATPGLADVTIIMLTALDDRAARHTAFSAGADDFLSKPFDRVELRLRLRGIARLNRFRRLTEQHREYEDLARLSPDGILSLDADGHILFGNPSAAALVGMVSGRPLVSIVHDDDRSRVADGLSLALHGRDGFERFTARLLALDGEALEAELTLGRVAILSGRQRASLVIRDLRERRTFESRLDRLSRAELVAGACAEIAHDAANFLVGTQIALHRAAGIGPADHPLQEELETASAMVDRAGGLLQALARFQRTNGSVTAIVDLNVELRESEPWLTLLTNGATLHLALEDGSLPVAIQPAELHQVLSNLVTNARQSMGEDGHITFAASPRWPTRTARAAPATCPCAGSSLRCRTMGAG